MFGISFGTLMLLAVVGILLYGEELPTVAKSFGKSLMELKKGMSHLQNEFHAVLNDEPKPRAAQNYHPIDDAEQPVAPKFEPPPAEPHALEPKS